MEPIETAIKARARRAYEFGRVKLAFEALLYIVPIVLLASFQSMASRQSNVALGVTLSLVAMGFLWRGEVYARAASTGLVSGAIPLIVPLMMQSSDYCCMDGACSSICLPLCAGSGLVAGLIVGMRVASEQQARWRFAFSAIVVSGLTGSLGCAGMGLSAVLGMVAAIAASSAPIAAVGMRLQRE